MWWHQLIRRFLHQRLKVLHRDRVVSLLHSVSAFSQKEAIEALLVVLALELPSGETISSKDEVGETGRWSLDFVTEEVTTGSSFGGLFSLWHFLDRRSPVRPALAFFSWALASLALLNLVVILEKEKKGTVILIKKKKKKGVFDGQCTLFNDLTVLSNFARRFGTKKMKK